MQSSFSAKALCPRRRSLLCSLAACAPLCALVPLLLAFPLFAQTSSPGPHRCLLVVETSHSMQRRAQGVSKTVKEFLDSSLHGQLHDTDSVALWTYNDTPITNGFLPWTSQAKIGLALRTADLLQPGAYEKKANLDKVLPEITRVLGQSDLITILLICSGDDKVQGTSVDQQLNDGCQQWHNEVLQARMPMVIFLRARHGQLTDWSVSPATWPIELPPLPETQATVSTAPQVPVVAANPPQLNPAPAIVQTNSATAQATAAPSPSTKPTPVATVSSNTPSTEINQASIVSTTPSAQAPPQTNATASPIVTAPKVSSPPAPPNPGPSTPTQIQLVETASTATAAPSARPASGTASQTPPPVEVPKSKDTNPSLTTPASAQTVPVPNGPLSAALVPPTSNSPVRPARPVADTLPVTATSIANTSVASSQPSPSLPPQPKPAALPFSPTPSSTVVETGLWISLIVLSAVGAIYFIWGWLSTYFRPRTPERIILQPRSTSPQIGPPAAASTPKATYPSTPQIIDRNRAPSTASPSPQKKETVQ